MIAAALIDMAWDQLAVGVAAIVGLIYVARTLRRSNEDVLEFLGNHMTKNTEVQAKLVDAVTDLSDEVKNMKAEVRYARILNQGVRVPEDQGTKWEDS